MRTNQLAFPNKRRLVLRDHPTRASIPPTSVEPQPARHSNKDRAVSVTGKENKLPINHDKLMKSSSLSKTGGTMHHMTSTPKLRKLESANGAEMKTSVHHFPTISTKNDFTSPPSELK